MFRRVILESWQEFVPYLCFALIGGSFLIILVRAILMKKSDIDRISHLPFADEFNEDTDSDSTPN
tara:strand:- start:1273 stop:1467 length:195 start_codon:yes stop_codon:yes gene_type:complete